MRKLRAIWIRLTGIFFPRRGSEEFAAELESHLELHVADGIRSGLSPAEARRRALIHLGGAARTREAVRERASLPWVEDLLRDLRYGLRAMLRNPGFTSVAILTLAVGIGATATVFTWINGVLLRPLGGVADPSHLATIESVTAGGDLVPNSYPDYRDFRDHLKLFDGIAVSHPNAFSVGSEEHSDRVWGELVSGNFFAVLGVKPQAGRLFLPSEYGDAQGQYPVAVISDRYWHAHFGADPHIIGTPIRINQHQITVIGVADPAFHGSIPAAQFDLWVPYMEQPVLNGVQPWMLRDRHNRNMLGIGRVRPGVTMVQARQELKALAELMAKMNSDVSEGMSATLLPLTESPHGPQAILASPLRVLMGVSILVLLIVCANVANLLMARATVREREFSARMALGARRSRIVRQVLAECLLLTLSGALLGVASAPFLARSLKLLMPPGPWSTIVSVDVHPSFAVLSFTASVCVLAALAAGMLPAFQVARLNVSARLNAGARNGMMSRSRNRLRSVLVASEVALALVALVGAALFARGFQQTMHIDAGFDPDHVLLSQLYLSTNGYNLAQRQEFCRRLSTNMESAAGVDGVAFSDGVPLGFEPSWWEELEIEGYSRQPDENMNIFRNVVSPGYLPLLHIPMVDGRNFTEQDNENAPLVMIVNQTLAHRYFHDRNPIGKRVHGWGRWFRIVGVVKDSKYHYLNESPVPYFYVPFRQVYREDMNLAVYVRTHGDPDGILPVLRAQAHSIDPNVTIFDAAPLHDFIGASLYPQKIAASLMSVMSALAVLLAAVGLYSVMAYWVAQRTQEIGVRMALGARPAHVLRMVVRKGLGVTLVGIACGMALAAAMARGIAAISFSSTMGVRTKLLDGSAMDPLVYIAAAASLCLIAFLACWYPARRAASVNPTQALRAE
jgi:predicted permease